MNLIDDCNRTGPENERDRARTTLGEKTAYCLLRGSELDEAMAVIAMEKSPHDKLPKRTVQELASRRVDESHGGEGEGTQNYYPGKL